MTRRILVSALIAAFFVAGAVHALQSSRPTTAAMMAGPQQPSMGVPIIAPIWPDTANPSGILELTLDRGGFIQGPPMVRVQLRLRTGSIWRDTTLPLRVQPGQHVRISQRATP